MFLPVRGGLVSSTQQMSSVMETMSESGGFTSEDACFDLYEDEMIILKVNCQRLSGIMDTIIKIESKSQLRGYPKIWRLRLKTSFWKGTILLDELESALSCGRRTVNGRKGCH